MVVAAIRWMCNPTVEREYTHAEARPGATSVCIEGATLPDIWNTKRPTLKPLFEVRNRGNAGDLCMREDNKRQLVG